MKIIIKRIGVYGLWIFSTLVSLYLFFVIRDLAVLIMEALEWNHYTINFLDKVVILIIGLLNVVFILGIEYIYIYKNWTVFFLVTAIQLLLHAIMQIIKIKLVFNEFMLLDYYIFYGSSIFSIVLIITYLKLKNKNKKVTNEVVTKV